MTEQAFHDACIKLFALVEAKYPERGIQALFKRAQQEAQQSNTPLSDCLLSTYQAARERTLKRLALLKQCPVTEAH